MATPHVAGVAALMLAQNPALTPDQVETKLKASARWFPAPCSGCGTGILDANAALNGSVATPPATPQAEVESNNTIDTANLVATAGTLVNATIGATTDTDYFLVRLPAGKQLSVTMTPGTSEADDDLYLYNTTGAVLARSENGSGAMESVSARNTSAATVAYYIGVRYYSGGTGATAGNYTVQAIW